MSKPLLVFLSLSQALQDQALDLIEKGKAPADAVQIVLWRKEFKHKGKVKNETKRITKRR